MKSLKSLIVMALCLSFPALAAKKALIIANDDYQSPIPALTQAIKAGEIIEKSLQQIHFDEVVFLRNQNLEALTQNVKAFSETLDKQQDLVFVYLTGHGTNDQKDYFLPIDFDGSEQNISTKAIAINELANQVSDHSRHAIFIIDISRDPLKNRTPATEVPPSSFSVEHTKTQHSLGSTSQINSNFTLFSVPLGNSALDENKFAQIIAAELLNPQSIEQMRLRVMQQMQEYYGARQLPSAINQLDAVVDLTK